MPYPHHTAIAIGYVGEVVNDNAWRGRFKLRLLRFLGNRHPAALAMPPRQRASSGFQLLPAVAAFG